MPGYISHYMFAKDCLDKLSDNNLKNILSKNINIYLLGSCGPNLFEYSNKFSSIFSKNLSNISTLIHSNNINLFFEEMINYSAGNAYMKHIFSDYKFEDITIPYFCGFLSHYILDRSFHPYIIYLQSNLKNKYKLKTYISLHKSIETHIDTLLLKKFKNTTPKNYIKNINFYLSNREMLVICDMYNFLLKSVFNKDISYNDINKSISTLKKTQIKLIYSNSISSRLYLFNKNLFCKTCYIENKTYDNFTYCYHDLLNEKYSPWLDPFSKEKYTNSLLDIYSNSINTYHEIIDIFSQYIQNNKNIMDILNKIGNKSYITNQNFSKSIKNNL